MLDAHSGSASRRNSVSSSPTTAAKTSLSTCRPSTPTAFAGWRWRTGRVHQNDRRSRQDQGQARHGTNGSRCAGRADTEFFSKMEAAFKEKQFWRKILLFCLAVGFEFNQVKNLLSKLPPDTNNSWVHAAVALLRLMEVFVVTIWDLDAGSFAGTLLLVSCSAAASSSPFATRDHSQQDSGAIPPFQLLKIGTVHGRV